MASKKCPQCGLWNTENAVRCDCSYQFPLEQKTPPVQRVPSPVKPQPNAALVDHLVDTIRFNPDPTVRRAVLDELEHLGMVESL